jgi:hypothetical protein
VLDFKNGNNVLNGATTQGLGTLAISTDNVGADAVVTINGGTHTAPLILSGSSLSGDAHTFTAPARGPAARSRASARRHSRTT